MSVAVHIDDLRTASYRSGPLHVEIGFTDVSIGGESGDRFHSAHS